MMDRVSKKKVMNFEFFIFVWFGVEYSFLNPIFRLVVVEEIQERGENLKWTGGRDCEIACPKSCSEVGMERRILEKIKIIDFTRQL